MNESDTQALEYFAFTRKNALLRARAKADEAKKMRIQQTHQLAITCLNTRRLEHMYSYESLRYYNTPQILKIVLSSTPTLRPSCLRQRSTPSPKLTRPVAFGASQWSSWSLDTRILCIITQHFMIVPMRSVIHSLQGRATMWNLAWRRLNARSISFRRLSWPALNYASSSVQGLATL